MGNKLRFVVFGSIGNSDLGDDAYVMAAIDKIESLLGNSDWTILSGNPAETRHRCLRESHLGFMRPDPQANNRIIAYASAAFQGMECILWGACFSRKAAVPKWMSVRTKKLLGILINSDVIVNFGGGFLNEDYKKAFLSEIIFLWLCRKINKPVVLLAQSLGPFYSGLTKRLAARALNICDILTIREPDSFKTCRSMGLTRPKIELTADCALLLPPVPEKEVRDYARSLGIPSDKPVIGFSVRRWKYPGSRSPELKHRHYVETLAAVAESLAHRINAHIILVPSSTRPDDYTVCLEIRDEIKSAVKVHIAGKGTHLETVRKAICRCDLFIGTRLHPLIFATLANVPSLAISYTPKVAGYMEMLHRDGLVFPIEEVSKEGLFDACMHTWRNRHDERQYLQHIMKQVVKRAELNINILVRNLNMPDR